MRCPYCQRPVRLFALERRNFLKKVLPRCRACHRYVLTWAHKAAIALLGLAAFGLLLRWLGII